MRRAADTTTDMAYDEFHDGPFAIPFTNQLAFQTAFTPAGFNFESPFALNSTSEQNMGWTVQPPPEEEADGARGRESASSSIL